MGKRDTDYIRAAVDQANVRDTADIVQPFLRPLVIGLLGALHISSLGATLINEMRTSSKEGTT